MATPSWTRLVYDRVFRRERRGAGPSFPENYSRDFSSVETCHPRQPRPVFPSNDGGPTPAQPDTAREVRETSNLKMSGGYRLE